VDISQMTSSDVDDVARLINQLHPDQPGVIRPERVRQGWMAQLSVTATGRCSANDRSAALATRAVIRPSSR
jgi:hypothetical protein